MTEKEFQKLVERSYLPGFVMMAGVGWCTEKEFRKFYKMGEEENHENT